MADQLASPEDLATLLQEDIDRATAELLVECATAVVQNACGGQRILEVIDDEVILYLDEYDSGRWLTLPQRPVTAVSAVLIGSTSVSDWTPQLSRRRLYRADGWRSSLIGCFDAPSAVTVTYTHGYAAGDQRLQLARAAVLSLSAGAFSNPDGATREQIDDYAVQYGEMSSRMEATAALTKALRRQYATPIPSARLISR